jgi:hypothetical protein
MSDLFLTRVDLSPERVLLSKESLDDVWRTLSELGERTRDIFILSPGFHPKADFRAGSIGRRCSNRCGGALEEGVTGNTRATRFPGAPASDD